MLALIILIPNAIAKEKTEKCHLYFFQKEESAQIIWNLFLGFGTHLKVGIDFRFNAFFILQDRAKTFAVQRNSIRNIISDKFFYQLKLEKTIKKEYAKLTTNIATLMFQSSVETFYSGELIEVISFWEKKAINFESTCLGLLFSFFETRICQTNLCIYTSIFWVCL